MPPTRVGFYQERPGEIPVLDQLQKLRRTDRRAYAKCVVRIRRLAELGYELRRPEAAHLRAGIYELRIRRGRVNHRLLYFFYGRDRAILTLALTKEGKVPEIEIERAIQRRLKLEQSPEAHIYEES